MGSRLVSCLAVTCLALVSYVVVGCGSGGDADANESIQSQLNAAHIKPSDGKSKSAPSSQVDSKSGKPAPTQPTSTTPN